MNRCPKLGARLALAACFAFSLILGFSAFEAVAQETVIRTAPKDVVLGKMTVTTPPVVGIDGKEDRLSPGSRIRDTRNMVVLSASLAGLTIPVVYKRDSAGLVHEVWILTDAEYAKLSGVSTNSAKGLQDFVNTLALIFGARP